MTPWDSEFPADPKLIEMNAHEEADARRLIKATTKYVDDTMRMSCVSRDEADTIKAKYLALGGDPKRVLFTWRHG